MDKVVLFDGVCNLCHASVQKLIELDKDKTLKFASLQSDFGQELLAGRGLETENFKSFLYLRNDKLYTRSSAAIKVFSDLGGFWELSRVLYVFPNFIRDGVYNYISANRYKWFGKKESCWIATPDLRARFLD